jgi:hypothetical protein
MRNFRRRVKGPTSAPWSCSREFYQMRGTGTPMPPTDPLIYRFYELVMVNGPA